AATVARRPVPTPEAGADGVVKRKAVRLQLSAEAGEEGAGRLIGRQAGAAFTGDGDELAARNCVKHRSPTLSSLPPPQPPRAPLQTRPSHQRALLPPRCESALLGALAGDLRNES